MDLRRLLVALSVLLGVNALPPLPAETTTAPNPTTAWDVQNEAPSSKPPEQEHNVSRCHSNEDMGRRFVLQREFKRWFEALAACAEKGLQLAVPRSPLEAAALGAMLLRGGDAPLSSDVMPDALFVGVHNIDGGSYWRTIDGLLLSEAGFDLWLLGGKGECGALLGDGRYVQQPCHSRMRFACEAPRGTGPVRRQAEARGYVEVGVEGRFRLEEEPLPWGRAVRRCEQEGATLAVPSSPLEAGLLAGVMFTRASANARLQERGFFVGISDVAQEGQWTTATGMHLSSLGYSEWRAGEPSGGRRANCGVLKRDGRLAARPCATPMAFCCQEIPAPRPQEDAVVTRGRFRLHSEPLPWLEAVRACHRENASLLAPRARDRDIVMDMMQGRERDHYGTRVINFVEIHVAIYDSMGNTTWTDINEESQTPRRRVNHSNIWPRPGQRFNSYEDESPDTYNYNDFDNEPDREVFSVEYVSSTVKCVKMSYRGTFQNQICSTKLPYVCKSRE